MALVPMLKLYGLTALVFFAIDLVWIGVVAAGFYQKHLGHLMRPDVLWGMVLTATVSSASFALGRWLGVA